MLRDGATPYGIDHESAGGRRRGNRSTTSRDAVAGARQGRARRGSSRRQQRPLARAHVGSRRRPARLESTWAERDRSSLASEDACTGAARHRADEPCHLRLSEGMPRPRRRFLLRQVERVRAHARTTSASAGRVEQKTPFAEDMSVGRMPTRALRRSDTTMLPAPMAQPRRNRYEKHMNTCWLTLFDALPDPMLVADGAGRILYMNRAARSLFATDGNEPGSLAMREVLPAGSYVESLERGLRQPNHVRTEFAWLNNGG